jgi:hypothetical protein
MNNALAKAMRILHPPLHSFVFFFCISAVNPRPWRIEAARASVVSLSNASSLCSEAQSQSAALLAVAGGLGAE